MLAFGKGAADIRRFTRGGVWIIRVEGFWKCVHWMHFVWNQWKIIHSLAHSDVCIVDYVNRFDNGTSVLTNANQLGTI